MSEKPAVEIIAKWLWIVELGAHRVPPEMWPAWPVAEDVQTRLFEQAQDMIDAFAAMSDEQRMEVIEALPHCQYCGCTNPDCQCWNDE